MFPLRTRTGVILVHEGFLALITRFFGWIDPCPHCFLTGWLAADPDGIECDCGAALQTVHEMRQSVKMIRTLVMLRDIPRDVSYINDASNAQAL